MPNNLELYHYAFQKLIYLIHAYGSISEGDLYHTQVTWQHDWLKTRIIPKLATAVTYLYYKYSTLLGPWASEGGRGAWPLLDFEIISKKVCFFNFEG